MIWKARSQSSEKSWFVTKIWPKPTSTEHPSPQLYLRISELNYSWLQLMRSWKNCLIGHLLLTIRRLARLRLLSLVNWDASSVKFARVLVIIAERNARLMLHWRKFFLTKAWSQLYGQLSNIEMMVIQLRRRRGQLSTSFACSTRCILMLRTFKLLLLTPQLSINGVRKKVKNIMALTNENLVQCQIKFMINLFLK